METEMHGIECSYKVLFHRGRVRNSSEIQIPEEWNSIADVTSITVSLTPIGSHQNVIVKRIGDGIIQLQSNGGLPIDCFYHLFVKKIGEVKND
jgi:beta-mannanase